MLVSRRKIRPRTNLRWRGEVLRSILPAHVHELQALRVDQGLNQHLPCRLQGTRQNGHRGQRRAPCGGALPCLMPGTCGGRAARLKQLDSRREFQGPRLRLWMCQTTEQPEAADPRSLLNLSLDNPRGGWAVCPAWHCADRTRAPDALAKAGSSSFRTF